MSSTTQPSSPLAKLFAILVCAGAGTFMALMMDALTTKWDSDKWQIGWYPSPCNNADAVAKANDKHYGAFQMHVWLMSMAFGLFAPISAVTYIVIRDTLGLSQTVAKVVHGFIQLGSFVASILGYTQMYYAHGAAGCDSPPITSNHFQSVHSYIGIVVLVIYWWQFPSALVVFTNTKVLAPNTVGRRAFLKYHVFLGAFAIFCGLLTIVAGVLALEGKATSWTGDTEAETKANKDAGYAMYRASMAAFVTLFFLALALFEHKSAPLTGSKASVVANDAPLLTSDSPH